MPALSSTINNNSNINSSLQTQQNNLRTGNKPPAKAQPSLLQTVLSTPAAQKLEKSLLLQAGNVVSNTVSSLTSGIINTISGAVNSTVSSLTDLNASPISDPISSSLSGSKSTGSGANAFVTTPMNPTVTPVNFSNNSSSSALFLSAISPTSLTATSKRLGTTVPTSDQELSNLETIAFGAAANVVLGSVVAPVLSSVVSAILPSASDLLLTASDVNQQASFVQSNSRQFSSIAGGSTALIASYSTSYPSITDSSGNPVSGIPSNTNPNTLSTLGNIIHSLCNDFATPSYTAYANTQSMNDTVINLTIANGLTSFLTQLVNCTEIMTMQSRRNISAQLPAIAATGATALAAAAVAAVGGALIANPQSIIVTLGQTPNPTSYSATDIQSIMTTTNLTSQDVYGLDTIDSSPVWDSDTISNSDPSIMNDLVGSDITDMSSMPDSDFII